MFINITQCKCHPISMSFNFNVTPAVTPPLDVTAISLKILIFLCPKDIKNVVVGKPKKFCNAYYA